MSPSRVRWTQTEWISDSFESGATISQLMGRHPVLTELAEAPPLFRQNYFSQIPSFFVHEVENCSTLNSISLGMARDGSRTLNRRGIWRSRHSATLATCETIRSNSELVYRTVERVKFSRRHGPKSFLIAGWAKAGFSNQDTVDHVFRNLVAQFGRRNLSRIPISIYFEDGKKRPREKVASHVDRVIGLVHEIAPTAQVISASDLRPYGSSDGVCYVEINSRELIAETYLKHQVLSQGGGLFATRNRRKLKLQICFEQSPFHGFEIGRWR